MCTGYAGHNFGLNNPLAQDIPGGPRDSDAGPLPQGSYTIGPLQNNVTSTGTVLPDSMRLIPDPSNDMFERSGFLIHGGNMKDRSSSQGCIVAPRDCLITIGSSNDKVFEGRPMTISRRFICWSLSGSLFVGWSAHLYGQNAIAPTGSSSIHVTARGKKIDLTIRTARIESTSDLFPDVESGAKSSTVIPDLRINIDRTKVLVPRSVFADLLDPRTASIRAEKADFLLTISGGDGAESYFVRITFDSVKVKRRLLYSTLTPAVPSQETTYRLNVLKDE